MTLDIIVLDQTNPENDASVKTRLFERLEQGLAQVFNRYHIGRTEVEGVDVYFANVEPLNGKGLEGINENSVFARDLDSMARFIADFSTSLPGYLRVHQYNEENPSFQPLTMPKNIQGSVFPPKVFAHGCYIGQKRGSNDRLSLTPASIDDLWNLKNLVVKYLGPPK